MTSVKISTYILKLFSQFRVSADMHSYYKTSSLPKAVTYFFLLCLPMFLLSCSSNVPLEIREPLPDDLALKTVRADIASFISQQVRWGGIILHTENHKDSTHLTILAQPLNSSGRPSTTDISVGRFIAVVPAFLEPVVYKLDREMTFTGTIKGSEIHKVGEFEYSYPVIDVKRYYLWPEFAPISDVPHYPYWFYDPWYDPFYPYPYRYRY